MGRVGRPRCNLNAVMSKYGIREYELAEWTDMAQGYINRIKAGRVIPNVATAMVIARALGVTVEELWGPTTDWWMQNRPAVRAGARSKKAMSATNAPTRMSARAAGTIRRKAAPSASA